MGVTARRQLVAKRAIAALVSRRNFATVAPTSW